MLMDGRGVHRQRAEADILGVSRELAEREECLGRQLEEAHTAAQQASQMQAAQAAEAQEGLEQCLASVSASMADWQVQAVASHGVVLLMPEVTLRCCGAPAEMISTLKFTV